MTTHPNGWIPQRLAALFVLTLLLMVSCDPSGEILAPEVERIEISMPSGELVVGESMQLQAQAFANGGQPMSSVSFFWESEHDSVVTVNSAGRVTAVGPGTSDVAAVVREESATVTIQVQPEVQRDPLVIETGSDLPSGTVEEPYEVVLQASGGLPPYEWALQAGSLPAGLSFDGTASTISGTPTSTGSHQVTIQVRDQDGTVESRQFSIQIEAAPEAPTITTSSLPDGTVGASYSAQLSASGGETPYSWSLSSGSLPAGLSLNSSTGQISGTPGSAGTRSFTAQVTGHDGLSSTKSLSVSIEEASEAPTITTRSLPDGTVGESYSAELSASGGATPYSWSLSSGSLPSGLSLNSSTGEISGTPDLAGTRSFTVRVTGDDGVSGTRSVSMQIEEASEAPTITTSSLPDGVVGESYVAELSASGGETPYSWTVISGALPAGLTLSSAGSISGTPTTAGTSSFTVRVSGADEAASTRSLSMEVEARFFLDANGVTIRCPEADVGDTGVVNGETYTKRTRDQITVDNASTTCTSGITDMSRLFFAAYDFNEPIGHWDVKNVTDMAGMFAGATIFDQPLGSWDVSEVANMSGMFSDAGSFNQPLADWDVSNVSDMGGMFQYSGFNHPIARWDVSRVTNMEAMFYYNYSFDQPLAGWDVSNVVNMYLMFTGTCFNQPIGTWNVRNVVNMAAMFALAPCFDQPIGNWDVSKVTSMRQMFWDAKEFDQPLGNWDVSNVEDMRSMFENARRFNQDLSGWCVSNFATKPSWFDLDADSWTLPRPVWGTCP